MKRWMIWDVIVWNMLFRDYSEYWRRMGTVLNRCLYMGICQFQMKELIVDGVAMLELMKIQKSMVYFITALRSNEMLLLKLARTNFLGLIDEEKEILDDLAVDMSQALEMANIYTNILSSTLDAFASIINNNMNNVLKRLTSITIILSLPALVTGIYGMNVPIPFSDSHYAFYIPLVLSVIISFLISWYFMKKKWF